MKYLFLIICIAVISCSSTKTKAGKSDHASAEGEQLSVKRNTPSCVDSLIQLFMKEDKQNPPRKIFSYTYQGKLVFYVTAPCCDFFTDLYNSECILLGHPDGGITGRGDGKFPDFEKTRTNEKLVWEDKRN